jgi:Asp-tRNA(Asn)/Glu-tRNA(Gln) amidotransferase A subunit family amidase
MVDTKDFPTEYGSAIYKANQAGQDAAVVALLKFAGASIIGKTVRPSHKWWLTSKTVNEFAYVQNKMLTTNPIDTDHRPGVSSTGSGAAVADFQCHVGIGTQTVSSPEL